MSDEAFEGARVIRVIETTFMLRGDGTDSDPLRRLRQYWSEEGELLAECDPRLPFGTPPKPIDADA